MQVRNRICATLTLTMATFFGGYMVALPEAKAQAPPKIKDEDRPRGYKPAPPEVRAKLHANSLKRNGDRVAKFPVVTAPSWDCRDLGIVLPVNDQGNCGSCYLVSSADGCSMALIKAGKLPLDTSKGRLSSQFGLDCKNFGGCGGGDEAEVIDYIMKSGFPLTSDYGPYTARPGRCKTGDSVHTIANYGFCTPAQQQGVASTQDMKNSIAQYGPISIAFDASGCNGYQWPNVMKGGGRNVNHAVLCIGWRTATTGKTEFLGMNQWGAWGGPGGTFWIEEGSYSWGTEAIWIDGGAAPPPPPPPPPPPGPGAPVITSALTVSASIGASFSYQIVASNAPTAFAASGLPNGLTVNTSTGHISGTPTVASVSNVTLIAANSAGAGTATLVVTVGAGPVPGAVSIVLTDEQVQHVLDQSGGIRVTKDMTLQQLIDVLQKSPAAKREDDRIKVLERGITLILDRLDKQGSKP